MNLFSFAYFFFMLQPFEEDQHGQEQDGAKIKVVPREEGQEQEMRSGVSITESSEEECDVSVLNYFINYNLN